MDNRHVLIDGTRIRLARPDQFTTRWIGQEDSLRHLLAAWLVLDDRDLPLNPRLLGKPGVGKTSLAVAAARHLNRELYLVQATMDTRPEDLIITPVVAAAGELEYVASPLVTAMVRGGVCIIDEGNRMSEKSWASLAPLLDHRRYVESIVAGVKIQAHAEFRLVATMNEDASTYELPEYIHSRLQPQIILDFPEADEELAILREHLPFVDEEILGYVAGFLQRAHAADARFTVRDGINVARYAAKMIRADNLASAQALALAVAAVLGDDGAVYA